MPPYWNTYFGWYPGSYVLRTLCLPIALCFSAIWNISYRHLRHQKQYISFKIPIFVEHICLIFHWNLDIISWKIKDFSKILPISRGSISMTTWSILKNFGIKSIYFPRYVDCAMFWIDFCRLKGRLDSTKIWIFGFSNILTYTAPNME